LRRRQFSKPPLTQRSNLNANSFYLRDSYCDIATRKNLYFRGSNARSAFNRRVGVYQEVGTDRRTFAVISLWGKFGGLHACAATFVYIVPLPNIFLTPLFSKLRLKRKDFQETLRLPWAQEVPSSNLGAPTKNISRVFFYLLKAPFTSNPICGILADRRSGFVSPLLSESSPHDEFSKT